MMKATPGVILIWGNANVYAVPLSVVTLQSNSSFYSTEKSFTVYLSKSVKVIFSHFLSRLDRSHCRMCWQNMFKDNIEKKVKSSSMLIHQLISSVIIFISVEKRCQISASQTENIK